MKKRNTTNDLVAELKELAIKGDSTALKGITVLASKDEFGMESLLEIARKGNKEAVSYLLTLISENNREAKKGLVDIIVEEDKRIVAAKEANTHELSQRIVQLLLECKDISIAILNCRERTAELENLHSLSKISDEPYLIELSEIESRKKELLEKFKTISEECTRLQAELEDNKILVGDYDNTITYLIDLANNGDAEAMKALVTICYNNLDDILFTYGRLMETVKNNPIAFDCIETILRSEYNKDVNELLIGQYLNGSELAYSSMHKLAEENVFIVISDLLGLGLSGYDDAFDSFIDLVKRGIPVAVSCARDIIKHASDKYDMEILDRIKKALIDSENKSEETIKLLATMDDSGIGSRSFK